MSFSVKKPTVRKPQTNSTGSNKTGGSAIRQTPQGIVDTH